MNQHYHDEVDKYLINSETWRHCHWWSIAFAIVGPANDVRFFPKQHPHDISDFAEIKKFYDYIFFKFSLSALTSCQVFCQPRFHTVCMRIKR